MIRTKDDPVDLITALNKVFLSRYNSLPRYMLEAKPYTPEGSERVLRLLDAFAQEDAQLASRISDELLSRRVVPRLSPYPTEVGELNYLSLPYLETVLKEAMEKELKELSSVSARFSVDVQACRIFEEISSTLKARIAQLSALNPGGC